MDALLGFRTWEVPYCVSGVATRSETKSEKDFGGRNSEKMIEQRMMTSPNNSARINSIEKLDHQSIAPTLHDSTESTVYMYTHRISQSLQFEIPNITRSEQDPIIHAVTSSDDA